jgi:nucleoside-diphosphate kinase
VCPESCQHQIVPFWWPSGTSGCKNGCKRSSGAPIPLGAQSAHQGVRAQRLARRLERRYPRSLVGSEQREGTLVICKPDAVERGLVGEIIGRLERRGLRLARAELRHLDKETAGRHYGEHVGKPFYESLIDHITRSPVLLAVVEGPVGTWQVVRNTMGATNPAQAQPGTIRGDLALSMTENLIHGSDSAESARREIELFFGSQP